MITRRLALTAPLLLSRPLRALAVEPNRRPPLADLSMPLAAGTEICPAPTPPQAIELPILVYHHVVPDHAPGVLFVTPDGFEQQLKYLQDNGYRSISFTELADALNYGAPLPERPVILSFDDGWENQFQYGFPLLQKYGFSATFYIVSGYVDHQNFMTTDQLQTMIAAGMTIGGHSHTHPPLPGVGGTRLVDEIAGSKAWLEGHFGVVIDTFAYPYGAYTERVTAAVNAAGYRTARTCDTGTHATADTLATLPAVIYSQYANHYRGNVEVAAAR